MRSHRANLGLTKTTRFINVLDLGLREARPATNVPTARGYELTARAAAVRLGRRAGGARRGVYMQAVNRVAQAAVTARSEARESYLDYRAPTGCRRHYRDHIIPLRKRISQEVLLRYNGMLLSTQDLLTRGARAGRRGVGYIDALKDFWTAHANLEAALGGVPPAQTRNQGTQGTRRMTSRRNFISGAAPPWSAPRWSARPAPPPSRKRRCNRRPAPRRRLAPPNGRPYNPVVTLNGWTLPWRMKDGVKEFHLVAEPVVREIAPGMKANLWGYNGQSPGPTIEVVEGDRVRIFVTNKLPEATSVHWHGQLLPNGMDGVAGLSQPASRPARPSSTNSWRATPAPSCTTRTPTRWRRWRWA
jgi:hypothetical protein